MIGERLKELRKVLKLNQSEFGKLLNVSQRAISHWERGEAEPSIKHLQKISKLFNVNLNWLLTGEGEMFSSSGGGEYYNSAVGTGSQVLNVGTYSGKTVIVSQTEKSNLPKTTDENINQILNTLEEIKKRNPQAYQKAVSKLIQEAKALKELLL